MPRRAVMNTEPHARDTADNLKGQVQWLMFFRVIVASFFLGIAAVIQLQKSDTYLSPYLVTIYTLTGAIYLLTIVYVSIFPLVTGQRLFAIVQIIVDVVLITVLIFLTGGINSIFSFMYSISIISASILLYVKGGMLAATASSLLYALLILMQHYGLIAPLTAGLTPASGYSNAPVYFPIIVNASAFYLVAFLSSFIAEQAKKSRLQLRKSQIDVENLEALNENIIQSINSGMITLDHENRIMTFNAAAQEITGMHHEAVYMKNVFSVFPALEHHAAHSELSSGKIVKTPRFEIPFERPDGKSMHLGFSLSVLRDKSGEAIGTILSFQDLTSLKEMQDYIQRMDRLAALGRMAAGVAHEIRNPLASISGSVQVLRKDLDLSDADRRLMDIVVRESENLSRIISNFTQFVKPGAAEREKIGLKQVVDEVVEIFHNSPEAQHVRTLDTDIDQTLFVIANPVQLKQVFWNMIINAAQAMTGEPGAVSISAFRQSTKSRPLIAAQQQDDRAVPEDSQKWVEIQVQDSGCGIAEQDIESIFDPFYSKKEKGTGLGLSIVYKIIEDHGGSLSVKSTAGKGTLFSFYLPEGV